ncbi:MAG TPA: hypothetical protein VF482_15350, partial [Trebonia sp.]
ALTVLWRPDSSRTLDDLPASLVEQTLTQFGQHTEIGPVREVLRGEERRFAGLLARGRKVLAQLSPSQPLTEADLRYLYQTHGLPPELVTELLDEPHAHDLTVPEGLPTRRRTPSLRAAYKRTCWPHWTGCAAERRLVQFGVLRLPHRTLRAAWAFIPS